RLGQGRVGVFLFEPPTGDVLALGRAMLVLSVVSLAHNKITHALVKQARHHRLLRKLDHAVVHHHAPAARAHSGPQKRIGWLRRSYRRSRIRWRSEGMRGFYFDVSWKRGYPFDERP